MRRDHLTGHLVPMLYQFLRMLVSSKLKNVRADAHSVANTKNWTDALIILHPVAICHCVAQSMHVLVRCW